jgi:hypothetical protein
MEIVELTARFVAAKGEAAMTILRARNDQRLAFIEPEHTWNAYFVSRCAAVRSQCVASSGAAAAATTTTTTTTTAAPSTSVPLTSTAATATSIPTSPGPSSTAVKRSHCGPADEPNANTASASSSDNFGASGDNKCALDIAVLVNAAAQSLDSTPNDATLHETPPNPRSRSGNSRSNSSSGAGVDSSNGAGAKRMRSSDTDDTPQPKRPHIPS